MNRLLPFAAAAAVLLLLPSPPARADDSFVEKVAELYRPNVSTNRSVQLSGITYAGGDLYYAVDDEDGRLYPLTLSIDRVTGDLPPDGIAFGDGIAIPGARDMEGCALDPGDGAVWVCDEGCGTIRKVDPKTGASLAEARVPENLRTARGNRGLESLSIAPDGRTMWTANEEALPCDGGVSTAESGTVVRLTRFVRDGPDDDWATAGQWPYRTDPLVRPRGVGGSQRSGVSDLLALPDGTLLVLERETSGAGMFGDAAPHFRTRLYRVDVSGTADVSGDPSLAGTEHACVPKRLLYDNGTERNLANYEALCAGPTLDDGSQTLVLVSDAGRGAVSRVLVLRMKPLAPLR